MNSDDHDSNREDIEMADNDSNIEDNINIEKVNYDYENVINNYSFESADPNIIE